VVLTEERVSRKWTWVATKFVDFFNPQSKPLGELPVVLGLNTSFTYLGVTVAGIVGAIGIPMLGAHRLGYLGASIVAIALVLAQMATWRIGVSNRVEAAVS
jgi:predicted MFS family arabinose efflux permease